MFITFFKKKKILSFLFFPLTSTKCFTPSLATQLRSDTTMVSFLLRVQSTARTPQQNLPEPFFSSASCSCRKLRLSPSVGVRPCAATTTRRPVSAAAPPVAAPAEASLLREKCGLFHLLRPTRLSGEEFSAAPAASPCPPLLLSHLISSPSAALTP